MPNTFVEEYRKEMSQTGYPFAVCAPLLTDTGYSFAIGTIEDASIYCDTPSKIPLFTAIEKDGDQVSFVVGDSLGTFPLKEVPEVLPLYTRKGIFCGIFVLNRSLIKHLGSWKDGTHNMTHPFPFCPRCLEMVPPVGVERIVTDSGEIMFGDMVISGGYGTTLQLLVSPSGAVHIETNFVGDPTYAAQESAVPIQRVICSDTFGTEMILTGDESKNVSIIASNAYTPGFFDDALRVEGFENTVRVSLGGR